ncbi:unnamed protein product [Miscanthus lutarioriparius]|uniref:Uncharacterized protein n=1 Tax=Miscanthus lutarioriparius TaxID=422564 RepID=A0A811QDU7_9POAL|nr:unnamed protein product [Miscanthus lutarioriparius]
MDENNQINVATHNTEGPAKSGRKLTINNQLCKRRAKGKHIDIKFPKEFAKVIIAFSGWLLQYIFVAQQKFPELSEEDKDCAMRQVESQYNNWRYCLLQTYRNKPRPQHVSPEGWQWLIRNLWTDDDFQKRSNQNSINRGKQEMGSKVGTRSIAQIAYDLRDPETGEWPTAMQVWRATYQKVDGTWPIPTGEEIITKLHEGAGIHQEKISSTPVPIVEALRTSSWSKAKHSCGVGIHAVNRVVEERIKLQEQIEASEQREAAARARADAAEQRARALEGQVSMMVKTNAQLQEEQQSQCDELSSLREAQSGEVARLVREQLDHQMAELIARIGVKRVILRFECS